MPQSTSLELDVDRYRLRRDGHQHRLAPDRLSSFREPPVDQPQADLATARAGAAYTSVVPH
jgi:hypothetical protein